MSAATSFVARGTGPSLRIRNMAMFSKPQVDILLVGVEQGSDGYIHSYSTMDKIEGIARIQARHDTRFDDVEIAFLGITRTYVDKMASTTAMSGRQEATHRFLKLTMPIKPGQLPEPRILEAGKVYEIPFTFVIPQHLLLKACVHKIKNDSMRDIHLQVPPSLGDPDLSGYGSSLLDDMAPMMARIQYAVRVQVWKYRPEDDSTQTIVETSKKIRVKPVFEEQPPLDLDIYGKHEDYCLRQEKTIRKGVLKGKLGRLVMEASQPKAFQLPAVAPGSPQPAVSTMVRLSLRFDPADDKASPPRLGSLGTKLKVSTYFASTPRQTYPTRANLAYDMSQGYISEFLSLSSMCIASVEWRKHSSWESPASRRDSAMSTASSTITVATISSNTASSTRIPDPSIAYRGTPFYTASVLVPLSLPTHKHLVPTFHSCLVSRVYGLHVSLSCSNSNIPGSALALKLPVQIAAEGSVGSAERRRRSMYVDMAMREADEAFEPRNVGPPPDVFLGQSRLTNRAAEETESGSGSGSGSLDGNEPPVYSSGAGRSHGARFAAVPGVSVFG